MMLEIIGYDVREEHFNKILSFFRSMERPLTVEAVVREKK
jgi:hypothetical protein